MIRPASVTDAERAIAARWLWWAAHGGEHDRARPFNLGKELTKRGISKADLAQQLGVTDRAVRHWCFGTRRPSPPIVRQLSAIFHISPHRLEIKLGPNRRRRPLAADD